jgi:dihydropteroate synthase
MGVINVTPDSFSDGGLWLDADDAVAHGVHLAAEGADVLDVGGESTRPGAEPVPEEEELRRVLPVISALTRSVDVPISIDTRKPNVARAAVEVGASIVNDTAGEAGDRALDAVAAETTSALIVMHSRGTPQTMSALASYRDVVEEVTRWLLTRASAARQAGVSRDAIALDPGFGFAKSAEQSLELLRGLDRLTRRGYPVVVGTSRKSFIGAVLELPADQRLEGTAATVAWAVAHGASIVRVHDVEPMVRVVRMTEAVLGRTKASA